LTKNYPKHPSKNIPESDPFRECFIKNACVQLENTLEFIKNQYPFSGMLLFLLMNPPQKTPNIKRREREFLTPNEMDKLIAAAKKVGRHGHRDSLMILLAYRHGLRVSELVTLRWQQIDLTAGLMQVNRRKNGLSTLHPLFGPELRGLRKIKRDYPDTDYVFITERDTPITDSTFRKIVARAGIEAQLPLPVHPHMLRHSTGYKLANDSQETRTIQQYLGHKNIRHTVRYTEVSSAKFTHLWPD
jgi:type 1 fimbriae regulatory protein FimB/type 1 fimbriae regulatory protein FimE